MENKPYALPNGDGASGASGASGGNNEPARIVESRVYRGPNPYGYRPVVRFKIDLGWLEAFPTNHVAGFNERLLELIPTLKEHGCSNGVLGGFVRRMEEGTWLAHVAEHIAIEMQCLAATPVTYGKTRQARNEPAGVYDVVYSYNEERVGLLAGILALRVVNSLLPMELQGIENLAALLPREMVPLGATGLRQVPAAHSGKHHEQKQPYRRGNRKQQGTDQSTAGRHQTSRPTRAGCDKR